MLMAHKQMFGTEVIEMSWHQRCVSERLWKCVLSLATPSSALQKTIIALEFNTFNNESRFSPTQTDKHYIHYFRFFFLECDLICVTHLGVQYC